MAGHANARGISPAHRATIVVAVLATLAAVVLLVLLLTRGSGSSNGGRASAASAPASASVTLRRTKLGRILTDRNGLTLYLFQQDKHGRSTCFASCAHVWPPALVQGKPHAGPGLDPSKLGTTIRGHGRRQLVYDGHPLYRMNADVRPGQMQGEGFLATWWVVAPSGRRVVAPGLSTKASGY